MRVFALFLAAVLLPAQEFEVASIPPAPDDGHRNNSVSISQIVETYLDTVTRPAAGESPRTPVLNSLRGTLRKGDREDYRRYLVAKYL